MQRRALMAAWLGWAFDGLDGYLYIMVATPFVTELIAAEHGFTMEMVRGSAELSKQIGAEVGPKAALIQSLFLVGWALGGAFFGRLGDRLGRCRTLTLTILVYALFTGLSVFATRWWHLLIFRFVASLGIGGEWAAGSALVSETLPSRHRAWASATLQSGYMVGCIAAALTSGWMSHISPRWVFVVGILPALVTFWIRKAVPEPAEWKTAAKDRAPVPIAALFKGELRRVTLLTIALSGIALTTVWTFLYFSPQAIAKMKDVSGWEPARVKQLVTNVTVAYLVVNIAGNFMATYLGKLLGYRRAFTLLFLASLACFLIFFQMELTLANIYPVMCVTSLFALGLFGLFPLYVPPLFPTLMRTLGAGFTYNAGRLVSAGGTYFGGVILTHVDGPAEVIWWTGLLFIPGVLIAMVCPVPRGETGPS